LTRPGAPLSPGLVPAGPGPPGAVREPGTPLSPDPHPGRWSGRSCLRPGAPLSPGLNPPGQRPGRGYMRARRPALARPSSRPMIRPELFEARRPALAGPQPTGPAARQGLYW